MKIETDTSSGKQCRIDSYEDESITINGVCHTASLIISPNQVIKNWQPGTLSDLATQHVHELIRLGPEIIIIGTGKRTRFPPPGILAEIFDQHIGLEVMDTGSACRCYNLLLSENRNVVAGLIMPNA